MELSDLPKDFPRTAWTIKGTDPNGGVYISRKRDGAYESDLLKGEKLRAWRQENVDRMLATGWNVVLVREQIGDDCLWHEVDPDSVTDSSQRSDTQPDQTPNETKS